jgi:hypothetical protein
MVPSEWAANRPSEHIEGVSYVPHFHPCSCRSEWRRSIFDPARLLIELGRVSSRGRCSASRAMS